MDQRDEAPDLGIDTTGRGRKAASDRRSGPAAFVRWSGRLVGFAFLAVVAGKAFDAVRDGAREAMKPEAQRKAEEQAEWLEAKAKVDQIEEDRRRAAGPLDPGEPLAAGEAFEDAEGRHVCRVQLGDGGLLVTIPAGLELDPDVPDRDPEHVLRAGGRAVLAPPDDGPGCVVLYADLLSYVRAHWWDDPGKWDQVRERAGQALMFAVPRGAVVEVVSFDGEKAGAGRRRSLVKLSPGGRMAWVMECCLR